MFMAKRVTDKQKEVLQYISTFLDEHGYAPAIRDVATGFDCSVKGAYDHVIALEKKGLISRDKNRSRSIQLGQKARQMLHIVEPAKIPVLGRIAAGPMSLAVETADEYISAPAEGMFGDGAKLFALRVKGDSMINAGIREHDIAIFREQQSAQPGDIVAALVEEEATVKFYFTQNGRVVLKAANPMYQDMFFPEVRVIGKLQGLIRVY
jgi:repressor LexA